MKKKKKKNIRLHCDPLFAAQHLQSAKDEGNRCASWDLTPHQWRNQRGCTHIHYWSEYPTITGESRCDEIIKSLIALKTMIRHNSRTEKSSNSTAQVFTLFN